jgi:hypothetical protein
MSPIPGLIMTKEAVHLHPLTTGACNNAPDALPCGIEGITPNLGSLP